MFVVQKPAVAFILLAMSSDVQQLGRTDVVGRYSVKVLNLHMCDALSWGQIFETRRH